MQTASATRHEPTAKASMMRSAVTFPSHGLLRVGGSNPNLLALYAAMGEGEKFAALTPERSAPRKPCR